MSGQFYAIDENGVKVANYSNELLGVIPIITASYLSFEDMSWSDLVRVSHRVGKSNGCYVHRLGEKKSIELTDGSLVKATLVGLVVDGNPGFVFQITDGLRKSLFNNFMVENLYERFPDDLKKAIVSTANGFAWLPSIENIMGPDTDRWYEWYEYHNEPNSRRVVDNSEDYSGYWVRDTSSNNIKVINDNGYLVDYKDNSENVPSICFSVR